MEKFENKVIDMREMYQDRKEKGLPMRVPDAPYVLDLSSSPVCACFPIFSCLLEIKGSNPPLRGGFDPLISSRWFHTLVLVSSLPVSEKNVCRFHIVCHIGIMRMFLLPTDFFSPFFSRWSYCLFIWQITCEWFQVISFAVKLLFYSDYKPRTKWWTSKNIFAPCSIFNFTKVNM